MTQLCDFEDSFRNAFERNSKNVLMRIIGSLKTFLLKIAEMNHMPTVLYSYVVLDRIY